MKRTLARQLRLGPEIECAAELDLAAVGRRIDGVLDSFDIAIDDVYGIRNQDA